MFEGSQFDTRAHRSGRLGEAFCKEQFGIVEPNYEIKSFDRTRASFVVQSWQLLEQLWKQYVIVGYRRKHKTISRGPNKGRRKPAETVEAAYRRKVEVWVLRGHKILQGVLNYDLKVYCTARGGDLLKYGKWGIVWRIPVKVLPDEVYEDNDRYTLYCNPDDSPEWTGEFTGIQDGLFARNKDESDGDKEVVPF
jgi:hypothetical protein